MNILTLQNQISQLMNKRFGDGQLFKPKHVGLAMSYWPPLLAAGISIIDIQDDWMRLDVRMKMRWYNRNYVGTHFGGSLFAMTDPFYMLMLINILGKAYRVWDQAAKIDFIKPGVGCVTARFELTSAQISEIKQRTENGQKLLKVFPVTILDATGEVVARVERTVYVREKQRLSGE